MGIAVGAGALLVGGTKRNSFEFKSIFLILST